MNRRFSKFSLRGLLITTTLLAITAGIFTHGIRRQHQAVAQIRGLGAHIRWEPNWLGRKLPDTLTSRLNQNVYLVPTSADFQSRYIDGLISELSREEFERAIASINQLPSVEELSFRGVNLDDEDLRILWRIKGTIKNLAIFNEYNSGLTASDLKPLANWTELRRLRLWSPELKTQMDLSPIGSLRKLESLSIGGAELTKQHFQAFSKLNSLIEIQFHQCRFTGQDLRCMHTLSNLQMLRLYNIKIQVDQQPLHPGQRYMIADLIDDNRRMSDSIPADQMLTFEPWYPYLDFDLDASTPEPNWGLPRNFPWIGRDGPFNSGSDMARISVSFDQKQAAQGFIP